MNLLKHVCKRILLVLAAYLLAVLVGLVAVALIFAGLSALPDAPDYFTAVGISPVVVLVVPTIGVFIYLIALVLTAVQALVLALLAEALRIRNAVLHALFGLAVAVSGFVYAAPTLVEDVSPSDWGDIVIVGAAGLVGGVVYWLVAGRDAGFRATDAV